MRIFFEQYKTMIIGGGVILLAGVVSYFALAFRDDVQTVDQQSSPIVQVAGQDKEEEEEEKEAEKQQLITIFVDIKGAVKKPGLYRAEEGERVQDIIQKAGGLQEKADKDFVNLAQKVEDEMLIYIPEIGEDLEARKMLPNDALASEATGDGKVDINTADEAELETLSGIGPSKAQTIIEFREQNGPFQEVDDLKNVSGIGEKTFEKIVEHITVR